MAKETDLDRRIQAAIASLRAATKTGFDIERYRLAFQNSAREKAEAVLELLGRSTNPMRGRRPAFVSVGGADGEELRTLLSRSESSLGVLIEGLKSLADAARNTAVAAGKKIEVIEGDAAEKLHEAMAIAESAVEKGDAEYVVVTCHAVVHELFDRSSGFDPLAFFSRIFQNRDVPIWFSYREPGAPEKWPHQILLRADCSPPSLLQLAELIQDRHPVFKTLVKPIISGDHIRVERTLAMEVLCKLFYLEDLEHEIQERSTSVEHEQLKSLLLMAIGDTSVEKRRADLWSESAPSESFQRNWNAFGISADGLVGSFRNDLPVPESHSRVIAYRLADDDAQSASIAVNSDSDVGAQIAVASSSLQRGDVETLTTLVTSFGRYWIETREKADAISLLQNVITQTPGTSPVNLFAQYLSDIAGLFAGTPPRPEAFSESLIQQAEPVGLGLLFEAERMEFARKSGRLPEALQILNTLQSSLANEQPSTTNLGRYAAGVVRFVIANNLRGGGLYRDALESIAAAERIFDAAVPSHSTELFHCAYARGVCDSMRGTVNLPQTDEQPGPLFAAALIRVTYSHAAWFTGDVPAALAYAESAAVAFREIAHESYAARATILADLIRLWLPESPSSPAALSDAGLTHGVHFLLGFSDDRERFTTWFSALRPSVAVGILQLRERRLEPVPAFDIQLPPMLQRNETGSFEIVVRTVSSLDEADHELRQHMGVDAGVRLPLYPD